MQEKKQTPQKQPVRKRIKNGADYGSILSAEQKKAIVRQRKREKRKKGISAQETIPYTGMLYIDDMTLVPLQLLLYKIISNIQFILKNASYMTSGAMNFPTVAARMATCVIAIAPMLIAFPFFEQYLARGLTIGSVKG